MEPIKIPISGSPQLKPVNDTTVQESDINLVCPIDPAVFKQRVSNQLKYVMLKFYYFSFISVVLFTCYYPIQNISSQILSDLGYKNLGQIQLCIGFIVFALFGIIAPIIVERNQIRWTLSLSNFRVILFSIPGLMLTYCGSNSSKGYCKQRTFIPILVICSILFGIGTCIHNIALLSYIHLIFQNHKELRPKYVGIYLSIIKIANIIGLFISSIIIQKAGEQGFFFLMMGINIVAILLHMIVPSVNQKIPTVIERRSYYDAIVDFCKLFKNQLIINRIPVFFFSGVITGFFSSFLYVVIEQSLGLPKKTTEQKKKVQEKTIYVMICLGAAQIISGIIIGKLNQFFPHKRMFIFQITTNITLIGFVISLVNLMVKNYTLSFFCAFFLGFSENFAWGIATISCNEDFKGNLSVFGLYKFFQNIGIAFCMLLRIFPDNISSQLFIFICIIIFVIANIFSADSNQQKAEQKEYKDNL